MIFPNSVIILPKLWKNPCYMESKTIFAQAFLCYCFIFHQEWRKFCNQFDKRVEDFNMGTLIRLNSREDFSESNSTLGKFVQSTLCWFLSYLKMLDNSKFYLIMDTLGSYYLVVFSCILMRHVCTVDSNFA